MRSEPAAAPRPAEALTSTLTLYLILGSLTMLGPFTLDTYLPAFPALSRDLHAPEAAIQLTLTGSLVGLAIGQLVAGPLSDSRGRRRPLLAGLVAYVLASLICAAAPSAAILSGARLLQGLAGGAALVIATASVRDRYSGREAARFFSLIVLVTGVAPLLAPGIGSLLLRLTSWRGIFVFLAVIGAALILAVATRLAESLPPDRRRQGGIQDAGASLVILLRARSFMAYALPMGLAYSSFFAYLATGSFVLQGVYHATLQQFSLIFSGIAFTFILTTQINGRVVRRLGPERMMVTGLILISVGTVAVLVQSLAGVGGLPGLVLALALSVGALGLVGPNAQALALTAHPRAAGAGSALLGVFRFAPGAVIAPAAGLLASGSAWPMGLVMSTAALGGLATYLGYRIRRPSPAAT